MKTKKQLIKTFKQLKRKQIEVLARHNELHPDKKASDFAEYQATWCEYCNLRDKLYNLRLQYRRAIF